MKARKLTTVITDLGNKLALDCPHCEQMNLVVITELEEVDRQNLDSVSAQVVYNNNCHLCKEPYQINMVVEEKYCDPA